MRFAQANILPAWTHRGWKQEQNRTIGLGAAAVPLGDQSEIAARQPSLYSVIKIRTPPAQRVRSSANPCRSRRRCRVLLRNSRPADYLVVARPTNTTISAGSREHCSAHASINGRRFSSKSGAPLPTAPYRKAQHFSERSETPDRRFASSKAEPRPGPRERRVTAEPYASSPLSSGHQGRSRVSRPGPPPASASPSPRRSEQQSKS